MVRGCLLLLITYGVAWVVEFRLLQALPFAAGLASVLALGVTLLLGSVQGLVDALKGLSSPQTHPSAWRDGQLVRVSGVIASLGPPVQAPFSRQAAVFCTYEGQMLDDQGHGVSREAPTFRGVLAVPCELQTGTQRLGLVGLPSLRELPQSICHGAPAIDHAAHHLAGTAWHTAPHLAEVGLSQLGQAFDDGIAGLPPHLISRAALEHLQMTVGRSTPTELRERLQDNAWQLSERVLPPGAKVTLVGTYRATGAEAAPALDIAYSVRKSQHALYRGGAASTARRQLRNTVLFIGVVGALTTAAHVVVHAQEGTLYRAALLELGLLP
jgi:hypothetical protein